MTSTSGGGFCLMTEGLGLAAMTETPVVVVNAQRPGPATGLPTRTAQGDLLFVIHASQDEFPRFVFAPQTVPDAFDCTIRAFDLSEKYQVPAIILTDQYLNDTVFLADDPFFAPDEIPRYVAADADLENPHTYQRYARNPSGVSPRALPCAGQTIVGASGNEHLQNGHTSEDKDNRTRMVDKRNAKLPAMTAEMRGPDVYHGEAALLLLGWGSSSGAIIEAVDLMREKEIDVGCLTFTDLWPFPAEKVFSAMGAGKKYITVELNSSAQFRLLLRQQTGLDCVGSILKYDGRPLMPEDIVREMDRFI
jgi:2-oxoglutarate ferredoxin oxidoreductase subunit alpha